MTTPFHARAPSFDAGAIQETIQRALAAAGLDTSAGPMHAVTETIRRALATGGAGGTSPGVDHASVVDVWAREVPAAEPDAPVGEGPPPDAPRRKSGIEELHHFRNGAGSRAYRVHVPAGPTKAPRPMIVMLHGCTQSAADFAAGTQMNRLADEHGFIVVYPEQTAQANASKCWNWFSPQDQRHGAGEPSLIAGIVEAVARQHGADPHRIFVAGLSAGAAMAVVLGETYPELFAGVGAHSGLAFGSAHDIPSALAAMKGGRRGKTGPDLASGASRRSRKAAAQAVPLIVFHGDRDHTVQCSNGMQIVLQARDAHGAALPDGGLQASTTTGVAAGGRRYSRTVHADRTGHARIESWTVHGAGHAWSGGHASGSYTDATGPDASAEMVRFFLALPRAEAA